MSPFSVVQYIYYMYMCVSIHKFIHATSCVLLVLLMCYMCLGMTTRDWIMYQGPIPRELPFHVSR